jgi:hypothetical protein
MEDFEKGFTVKWAHATEPQAYTIASITVGDMFWAGSTAIRFITGSWFMVMLQDTTSPDGVTTVPKGTYFMATTSIAHELKINPKECIKAEYIPDTIARTSDIPSLEGIATESYVDTKVANLVNSAPEALNTLDELAAALGDDANFATTVTNQIANKLGRDELPTAIDSALAQAKESGEFNGATPVRGTDYWTEADKAEIKSYVDEAILGGAW